MYPRIIHQIAAITKVAGAVSKTYSKVFRKDNVIQDSRPLHANGLNGDHLLLIRHGRTLANDEKRTSGARDVPLKPESIEDANKLGAILNEQGFKIGLIYTSELQRTIKTADEISKYNPGAQRFKDSRLNETCFGGLTNTTKEEQRLLLGERLYNDFEKDPNFVPPPMNLYHDSHPRNPAPGAKVIVDKTLINGDLIKGESYNQVVERVEDFYHTTLKKELESGERLQGGKLPLIVGHSQNLGILTQILNGQKPSKENRPEIHNTVANFVRFNKPFKHNQYIRMPSIKTIGNHIEELAKRRVHIDRNR